MHNGSLKMSVEGAAGVITAYYSHDEGRTWGVT